MSGGGYQQEVRPDGLAITGSVTFAPGATVGTVQKATLSAPDFWPVGMSPEANYVLAVWNAADQAVAVDLELAWTDVDGNARTVTTSGLLGSAGAGAGLLSVLSGSAQVPVVPGMKLTFKSSGGTMTAGGKVYFQLLTF